MPVLGALPRLGPWSLAGRPLPLGATACDGGVNFATYSSCATAAVLCLFTISDLKTAVISREEYGIPGPGGHCWPQMTGMIPVLKNEVKLNSMLNHTARINCLAWSLDSHLIATGSLDTCVIIYELGKPASSLITIKGAHQGGVYGIAFIDENSLASAREDACVRVWTLTPQ